MNSTQGTQGKKKKQVTRIYLSD